MKVESIMSKGVLVCNRDHTAQAALQMMRERDCGAVPVVDDGVLVGMVTDRDIALAAAENDLNPSRLRLSQIMSNDVFAVRPDTSISDAEELMRGRQIRRLPVIDENSRPIGMLSLNDIARAGQAHGWNAEEGLSAHGIASTLAAICQPAP